MESGRPQTSLCAPAGWVAPKAQTGSRMPICGRLPRPRGLVVRLVAAIGHTSGAQARAASIPWAPKASLRSGPGVWVGAHLDTRVVCFKEHLGEHPGRVGEVPGRSLMVWEGFQASLEDVGAF